MGASGVIVGNAKNIYTDIDNGKYVRGGVRCAVNIAIFCVGGKFTIVGFALSLVEAKYGNFYIMLLINN